MNYSEFYLAFENKFRGSTKSLNDKLVIYDGLLDEILNRFSNCSLLDIGSGRGEWLMKCQKLGIDATGIDNNLSMYKYCNGIGLNVKYGDALQTLKNFQDNSFQVITSFHFIEHISFDSILELLEQCKRILVSGGILILETPSIDNILVSSKNFYLDPSHITHIHPEAIKFVLDYFNFEESNYFLINSQEESNSEYNFLANLYDGAAQDVTIISRLKHSSDKSIFDENLDWFKSLNVSKNTKELISEYDQINTKKYNDINHELNLVVSQIEYLMSIYNRISNSFPLRLYRKLKAMINLFRVIPLRIANKILPVILKIKLIENIYYRLFSLLFRIKKKYSYKLKDKSFIRSNSNEEFEANKQQNDLLNLFNSSSRSSDILSDIKVKLQRK